MSVDERNQKISNRKKDTDNPPKVYEIKIFGFESDDKLWDFLDKNMEVILQIKDWKVYRHVVESLKEEKELIREARVLEQVSNRAAYQMPSSSNVALAEDLLKASDVVERWESGDIDAAKMRLDKAVEMFSLSQLSQGDWKFTINEDERDERGHIEERKLIETGERLERVGKYEEALECYTKALIVEYIFDLRNYPSKNSLISLKNRLQGITG